MSMSEKWRPGDRVRSTRYLRRRFTWGDTLEWVESKGAIEGTLVGFRSLQNGSLADGWWQTGRVPAALIATSLYRKPVPVPRERLERAE